MERSDAGEQGFSVPNTLSYAHFPSTLLFVETSDTAELYATKLEREEREETATGREESAFQAHSKSLETGALLP